MRDRCKNFAFLTQFHLQYASARSVREEKPCFFLLITNGIEKYWSRFATAVKKIISFSLNFNYNSLQGTVLEKKCLIFF